MMVNAFKDLPDDAKLWIYAFEQPLAERDREIVSERLASFVRGWKSHGAPVTGAFAILHDRFVLVAGKSSDDISGCSIDSSVSNFKWLKEAHGLDALNRGIVYFRGDGGDIEAIDRLAFQKLVDNGKAGKGTIVFDTTLTKLGELRHDKFETTFENCWHARLFERREPASAD